MQVVESIAHGFGWVQNLPQPAAFVKQVRPLRAMHCCCFAAPGSREAIKERPVYDLHTMYYEALHGQFVGRRAVWAWKRTATTGLLTPVTTNSRVWTPHTSRPRERVRKKSMCRFGNESRPDHSVVPYRVFGATQSCKRLCGVRRAACGNCSPTCSTSIFSTAGLQQ